MTVLGPRLGLLHTTPSWLLGSGASLLWARGSPGGPATPALSQEAEGDDPDPSYYFPTPMGARHWAKASTKVAIMTIT